MAAAATALGNQSTQGYLKNVYGGFNQIAQSNQKAASSAAQLADGTQSCPTGPPSSTPGRTHWPRAWARWPPAPTELLSGTESVSSGAAKVARGTTELAQGARKLHKRRRQAGPQQPDLATKGADYAGRHAPGGSGSAPASPGEPAGSRRAPGRWPTTCGPSASQCTAAGGSTAFCNGLDRARDRARVHAGASRVLARATGGLARANDVVAAGAAALAAGERRVAGGAKSLDGASGRLSTSARTLASGASSVAARCTQRRRSHGLAGQRDRGDLGGRLRPRIGECEPEHQRELGQRRGPVAEQRTGQGREGEPDVLQLRADALLADTVSQPVDLTHTTAYDDHANGWLLGAIVAVILWLAAMAGALRGRRAGGEAERAGAGVVAPDRGRAVAARGRPGAGPGRGRAAAPSPSCGVSVASRAAFVLVTLLAALCFGLIGYALRLGLGGPGVAVFVLFLLVQVAALGNVVPLETAPGALQQANGLMPLTAFTNATSQVVSRR